MKNKHAPVSLASPAISLPAAIVFEKRPRWAAELRRQFSTDRVRVIECRSVRDVEERSIDVTSGVVLLDVSESTEECLQFLRRRLNDPIALLVVVVGSDATASLEWPIRELGAAAFFSRKIPGHEMASLCERQWSHQDAWRRQRQGFRHP